MNEIQIKKQGAVVLHDTPTAFRLVDVRADAKRFPRIASTPIEQAQLFTRQIVVSTFLILGKQETAENIDFIATTLYALIMQDDRMNARYLSWYEAGRAVRNAAVDGELYGISAATLFGAMLNYIRTEGKDAERMAVAQKQQQQRALPPQVEAAIDKVADAVAKKWKV